jgi:putative flippase GtrA
MGLINDAIKKYKYTSLLKKTKKIPYFLLIKQNILSIQFFKYVLVGILNAICSTTLYFLCLRIFLMNYILAFTISWIFGILLTYVINFVFIFRTEEKLEFGKRLPKYFAVYFFSYSLNLVILKTLVLCTNADPFYLQFLILPLVIAINFTGFKYWALK